jgi:chromosome segregation ATPase
MEKKLVTGG